MPLESVFSSAGSVAMLGWLALLLAPNRWRIGVPLAAVTATLLAALYAAVLAAFWHQGSGGFGSLAEVAELFRTPGLLLAGWVHYLAFDLLIGTWQRAEGQRIGMSRLALAPCLVLTFLFGPLGWLAFLGVRQFHLSRPALQAA